MDTERESKADQGSQEEPKFKCSIRIEGMQVNTFLYACKDCRFSLLMRDGSFKTSDPVQALEHTLKHGDYCDATHPQYLAILGKLEEIILNAQERESIREAKLKELGEYIENKLYSGRSY